MTSVRAITQYSSCTLDANWYEDRIALAERQSRRALQQQQEKQCQQGSVDIVPPVEAELHPKTKYTPYGPTYVMADYGHSDFTTTSQGYFLPAIGGTAHRSNKLITVVNVASQINVDRSNVPMPRHGPVGTLLPVGDASQHEHHLISTSRASYGEPSNEKFSRSIEALQLAAGVRTEQNLGRGSRTNFHKTLSELVPKRYSEDFKRRGENKWRDFSEN